MTHNPVFGLLRPGRFYPCVTSSAENGDEELGCSYFSGIGMGDVNGWATVSFLIEIGAVGMGILHRNGNGKGYSSTHL